MPVKRRNSKHGAHRITPEAIEAYQAGDFIALHLALGLAPWQPSPLPLSIEPLGVDPDSPPSEDLGSAWADGWPLAVELQREIIAKIKGTA